MRQASVQHKSTLAYISKRSELGSAIHSFARYLQANRVSTTSFEPRWSRIVSWWCFPGFGEKQWRRRAFLIRIRIYDAWYWFSRKSERFSCSFFPSATENPWHSEPFRDPSPGPPFEDLQGLAACLQDAGWVPNRKRTREDELFESECASVKDKRTKKL